VPLVRTFSRLPFQRLSSVFIQCPSSFPTLPKIFKLLGWYPVKSPRRHHPRRTPSGLSFGCRSRTQEFPNNNPASLLRTSLRSSPVISHSYIHQVIKAEKHLFDSSLTGQVAATMASTQRHMAADRLRCERGYEWAARSKFSPNQLARYATRARQGNATPERSGISCKDHPPPPTHELKCEGPCDRRRDLRFFSKNTRKKGTNVSAL
jgi:hypothetical protein